MSVEKNRKLLLSVFNAIEQRNDQRFSELLHSDFEIHWPPSLPYDEGKSKTWTETWDPFQPTELERRMDHVLWLLMKLKLSSFGDNVD